MTTRDRLRSPSRGSCAPGGLTGVADGSVHPEGDADRGDPVLGARRPSAPAAGGCSPSGTSPSWRWPSSPPSAATAAVPHPDGGAGVRPRGEGTGGSVFPSAQIQESPRWRTHGGGFSASRRSSRPPHRIRQNQRDHPRRGRSIRPAAADPSVHGGHVDLGATIPGSRAGHIIVETENTFPTFLAGTLRPPARAPLGTVPSEALRRAESATADSERRTFSPTGAHLSTLPLPPIHKT